MAFSAFTDVEQVRARLGLTFVNADLLAAAPPLEPPEWLAENISWNAARRKRPHSEMYAREFLISPLLGFAIKRAGRLNLFSNEYRLDGPADFTGTPDYVVSYPATPGAVDVGAQYPLLAVAEAKREDFNAGWAQCAAELYACREVNARKRPEQAVPLWGIVTSGFAWEFGRLEGDALTIDQTLFDLDPLPKLLGALAFVFAECLEWGERAAGRAPNEKAE